MIARGIGTADDNVESFEILKEPRIQFDLEAAGSTGRTVVRLADLLGGTDVEFEHEGLAIGGMAVVDIGDGKESVAVVGRSLWVVVADFLRPELERV